MEGDVNLNKVSVASRVAELYTKKRGEKDV
jgi:hypothetical protein